MDEGQPTTGGNTEPPVPPAAPRPPDLPEPPKPGERQPGGRRRADRPAGAHRLTGEDTQLLPRLPGRRRRLLLVLGCVALAAAFAVALGLAVVGLGGRQPGAAPTGDGAGVGAGVTGPSIQDNPPGTGSADPTASTRPSRSATPSPSRSPGAQSGTPAAPAVGTPSAGSPSASPSPTPSWTTLTVTATRALVRGDSVRTNRTTLAMRADGNLAIVDENGTTRWLSGTSTSGSKAVFQSDGNFVVYDAAMNPLWSSRTDGHNGAVLVLQADGDVCVVYQGTRLWCAGTAH